MYKAFISYSHSVDGKLAAVLQRALQGFAKPWYKLRNFNVFRDEDTLSPTHDLEGNIRLALKEAEFLILMACPTSAHSKWVQREVEYWVENKPLDKLIVVLTDGEIIWIDEHKTFEDSTSNALPGVLRKKFLGEPFYIDLRELKTVEERSLHNPLFKKEVLKLAAQLHNKEPKDLAGDEVIAHRKMINVRNGAIGVLGLLLIAALIAAFVANKNRKQAVENEREAKRQENIAVAQRDSANMARAYAVKQERIAKLERDTAIVERNNAARQREIAISQRNQTMANYLLSEARAIVATDPTIALRLLEQAMRYHYTDSIKQTALNIYFDNNFYKSVDGSEIPQSRLGISTINARFYLDPYNIIYSSDANLKKVEIKLPFKPDYKVNLSPDSSHIVAFSKEGKIKVRRIRGKKIEELKIDSITDFNIEAANPITDVKLLVEKRIILVTEDYGTVVSMFDFHGRHVQDLRGHEYPIITVFSPDVNSIYTSSQRYYMTEHNPNRKWTIGNTLISEFENAESVNSPLGRPNHKFENYYGKTFSPDGKSYLENRWSDHHQCTIASLFDLRGKRIIEFFDPLELVTAASFSPDGKYIFTGLGDGRAKMYLANGVYLKTFDFGNQTEISFFSFTSDKKNVLICSNGGKCWSWELPLPLEAFLKSDKIEPLSIEQKEKYGIQ